MSMPPNSTEGAARAEQADRVEEMELESVLPKTGKQPTGPGAAITLVATSPLRRPTPWLQIALIASGLCAAAAGWLVHRMEIADHETADASAQERARFEQQLAAHQNDQRLQAALARNRIRDQAIEQQLAGRRDQEALVWERARSKELEQQLAARQGDQEALAQERARSLALERELVKHRDNVAIPLPAFELIPTWTAPALNSINPVLPSAAARETTPAAPTDKPAVDKAPIDTSAADARDRGRY